MHLHLTCFDGQTDAPVQYCMNRLMKGIQGFTWCHWMLPLGKYLQRIALADNEVVCKGKSNLKYTIFAGHFNGRGGVPVQYCVHCLIEGVQGYDWSQ
jgi:hypothetical protein